MSHTKAGRTKKAHDAERRQRERELAEALERGDEPEPPLEDTGPGGRRGDADS